MDTSGGANDIGKLLDDPPAPGQSSGDSSLGKEPPTQLPFASASLSSKMSSATVEMSKLAATARSASPALHIDSMASESTSCPNPTPRKSREKPASQPPTDASFAPDPQRKLYQQRPPQQQQQQEQQQQQQQQQGAAVSQTFHKVELPPKPTDSAYSFLQQQPSQQPPSFQQQTVFSGAPTGFYVNRPSLYKKPLPPPPPAVRPLSMGPFALNAAAVASASPPPLSAPPDTPSDPTAKRDFELVVEGVPAKLFDDEDEDSLKYLLEEWEPAGQGVSADGDSVTDITPSGKHVRCKIHTSQLSEFHFDFHYVINWGPSPFLYHQVLTG